MAHTLDNAHACAEHLPDERTVIDLPLEVKADGAPGEFEGYGAVFGNVDRDGDIVAKGAFAESLKGRTPALLWQHNAKEPIGRFDVVREDAKGLYVKGRLSRSGRGAEAYELLKMGALNGLSIGFVTKEAQRNGATGTRTILRADLMEVSLVTFPANELARIETVKERSFGMTASDIETPRDFERMLRGSGFSRARAKAITAKGFTRFASGGDYAVSGAAIQLQKEIVNDLEAKRVGLLRQFLGRRRSLRSGSSLPEVVDSIAGVYRTLRGTPMPIYLMPGESKSFRLPLSNALQSKPVVTVRGPKGVRYEFKCDVSYWAWTVNGPRRRSVTLTDGQPSRSLEIGSKAELETWLRREGGEQTSRDALERFESAIARASQIANSGLSPWGTITRGQAQSRVLLNDEGPIREAVPFYITAR